ncbi:hypothetical protein [Persicobacter psychrovividus]|uniref:Uncharacterized protein n=1 Tax=Persicobacter psychrovividus TaxID=387638 RepID=A0ABM7VD39_9BACT|nr:hypothetical protein PEPS_11470 [Persicobacter psychrovividus]
MEIYIVVFLLFAIVACYLLYAGSRWVGPISIILLVLSMIATVVIWEDMDDVSNDRWMNFWMVIQVFFLIGLVGFTIFNFYRKPERLRYVAVIDKVAVYVFGFSAFVVLFPILCVGVIYFIETFDNIKSTFFARIDASEKKSPSPVDLWVDKLNELPHNDRKEIIFNSDGESILYIYNFRSIYNPREISRSDQEWMAKGEEILIKNNYDSVLYTAKKLGVRKVVPLYHDHYDRSTKVGYYIDVDEGRSRIADDTLRDIVNKHRPSIKGGVREERHLSWRSCSHYDLSVIDFQKLPREHKSKKGMDFIYQDTINVGAVKVLEGVRTADYFYVPTFYASFELPDSLEVKTFYPGDVFANSNDIVSQIESRRYRGMPFTPYSPLVFSTRFRLFRPKSIDDVRGKRTRITNIHFIMEDEAHEFHFFFKLVYVFEMDYKGDYFDKPNKAS